MTEQLTKFDLRILDELQKDCTLSSVELGERVGLSQSPCWRRLQKLREQGYIQREVAVLERRKFEDSFNIFAYLKMSRLTDKQRADFITRVENVPQILECHTIFGDKDILIKVYATSMAWYQEFIFNTILKLPGVEDVQSTVTMMELKSTTAIPLAP